MLSFPSWNVEQPSIDDLLQAYKAQGIVGEESLLLTQTFCALGKASFGVYAPSGSGKSCVVEGLINLLPSYSVYRLEFSSKTAPYYDPRMHLARFFYVPELQKGKEFTDLLKTVSEGKKAKRFVTVGKRIKEFAIPSLPIIFTLASENCYKLDAELRRRCVLLPTDTSEEQTRQVLDSLASPERVSIPRSIKPHLRGCLHSWKVNNPYARELLNTLPCTLETRSQAQHLLKIVEGCTIFHHQYRKNGKQLQTTPEDIQIVKECALPLISSFSSHPA